MWDDDDDDDYGGEGGDGSGRCLWLESTIWTDYSWQSFHTQDFYLSLENSSTSIWQLAISLLINGEGVLKDSQSGYCCLRIWIHTYLHIPSSLNVKHIHSPILFPAFFLWTHACRCGVWYIPSRSIYMCLPNFHNSQWSIEKPASVMPHRTCFASQILYHIFIFHISNSNSGSGSCLFLLTSFSPWELTLSTWSVIPSPGSHCQLVGWSLSLSMSIGIRTV